MTGLKTKKKKVMGISKLWWLSLGVPTVRHKIRNYRKKSKMGGKGLEGFMGTNFWVSSGFKTYKNKWFKTNKKKKRTRKKAKLQEHPEGEAEIIKTSDPDIDGWRRCIYASSKFFSFFFILKKHIYLHTILPKKNAQTFFYGIQKQFQMKFLDDGERERSWENKKK